MEDERATGKGTKAADAGAATGYTLCVKLIGGPVLDRFRRKNPVISRTIEIPGDRDLDELHRAIGQAFAWDEDHCWEFQLGGARPQARKAVRYGMEEDEGPPWGPPTRLAEGACLASLGLRTRSRFFYWYDFGASWWHEIRVTRTDHLPRAAQLPRIIERLGDNPPQYPDSDDEG